MASDSKNISPNERLMRKRLAARLRQQRCRARKKELMLAKKQLEQHEAKGSIHLPAQPTKRPSVKGSFLGSQAPTTSGVVRASYGHQSSHPDRHPQTSKMSQSYPPHQRARHSHSQRSQSYEHPHQHHRLQFHPQAHSIRRLHQPTLHIPPPPPPPPSLHHHPRQPPHYASHRPVRPLYLTEPPNRMQSIGSVVSFDDGTVPAPRSVDSVPPSSFMVKQDFFFPSNELTVVPTVSPTMAYSKPVVEPDLSTLRHVPDRSPTKEETAIDAMLSLRSASFGA